MLNPTTIKEYAYSLGFDTARITSAEALPEAERVIRERIAEGLMEGLPWFTAERAEVSCYPDALLPGAQSIITLAMFYLTEQPDETQDDVPRGRISRYAWGDDYHEIIKPRLQQFAAWLREYARKEISDDIETRLFVDTGRMVDRAVAQRAGLGWYGKNTNILTKGWGSWVFLAEIVTNLPLQADLPLKTSCGSCEICLHACPTKALPAPYVLDNTRCISFLTIELRGSIPLELRPLMGNLIFGCDICQEVCPVNIVAEKRLGLRGSQKTLSSASHEESQQRPEHAKTLPVLPHKEFRPRATVGSSPELIPLLSLTEEQFRERFRHSPIRRAKRRGLLRNVCVALGNCGDQRAVPALIGALQDNEALIRGHAAWALGRIGGEHAKGALHTALATEENQEVQKEIQCALAEIGSL
ncbi:MAG: tRNA epoxyqueuosine(34) reductase QueG [Chloroflexi bacterium]|nr:MAG: tRNA epoxyqueuosine(34) reductase QueG [Chloroflexota bacterium]TMC41191.1 MAG: tRNA epoxyqueuosine(34) reductase QueG [Chloroflexota bacterium]TMD73662.1 MAG: tRNA epoxyqueuosine(34) reductase QueG [Chloroflexota bacterium]